MIKIKDAVKRILLSFHKSEKVELVQNATGKTDGCVDSTRIEQGRMLLDSQVQRIDPAGSYLSPNGVIAADDAVKNGTARQILSDSLLVEIEDVPLSTMEFFDIDVAKGKTLLRINSNHVFARRLLKGVSSEQREVMEVCLAAWARMERECTSEKRLAQLQLARKDWGQLLDDYLDPI